MQFFADLVSALTRLAGDDVNISQEVSNLQAAESKFEADVQAQTLASINAQIGPAVTAALAAAGISADAISSLTSRVQAIENDEAAADKNIPPAPVVTPTSLTISPTAADFVAGTASTVPLTITGGTAPYTASGLPSGVAFDGANLAGDTTTTAGTTSVTLSDASTPAVTGTVSVVVAAAPAA